MLLEALPGGHRGLLPGEEMVTALGPHLLLVGIDTALAQARTEPQVCDICPLETPPPSHGSAAHLLRCRIGRVMPTQQSFLESSHGKQYFQVK